MRKAVPAFIVIFSLFFLACNPCEPGAQRCNGTIVEICRPDKKWHKVQNCSKLHRTKMVHRCKCIKPDGKIKCYCCPISSAKKEVN